MTKKDPPSPLDLLAEFLVKTVGQMRPDPATGADVDATIDKANADMKKLLTVVEEKTKDPEVRAAATKEVEKLIELITNFGRALGGALATKNEPAGHVVREANSEQVADAMRKLLELIKNPSPEKTADLEAQVAKVGKDLEATLPAKDEPDDKKLN